jgi:hypothetical protein
VQPATEGGLTQVNPCGPAVQKMGLLRPSRINPTGTWKRIRRHCLRVVTLGRPRYSGSLPDFTTFSDDRC